MDVIAAQCRVLADDMSAGVTVVALAVQGLSRERLATIATWQGWSYLLRDQGHGFIRTAAGWTGPLWELIPQVGSQALKEGVKIWPNDHSVPR